MRRVGIVVLNYKKYKETIVCVESALQQVGVDLHIIIVDNGSDNESYEILTQHFNGFNNVEVIKAIENLGYAKGNNLGIKILQSKRIDFVCVANSDIVFSTNRIIADMVDAYKENVGIVVPIICNPDGTIDQRVVYKKKFFALRMLKAIIKRQFVYCKEKKHQDLKSNDSIEAGRMLIGIQNNCYVVSGSIFLLTPGFFKHYNQLFPETFLYFEEWATMIYLHKAKLKTLIASTDTIIHMGGASTPEVIKNNSIMKRKAIASSSRKVFKLIFMSQNGISKRYNNTKWKECCYNDKENI